MRSGELRALHVDDVDLDVGAIFVRGSIDDEEGEQDGKTPAAHRTVPIIPELRPFPLAHVMATGRRGSELVFGRTATVPFLRSTVRSRARKAWTAAGETPITMHQMRHTNASTMIAAGVDPGEVMRRIGHANVSQTIDRYTHALSGAEADTARMVQAYLDARVES